MYSLQNICDVFTDVDADVSWRPPGLVPLQEDLGDAAGPEPGQRLHRVRGQVGGEQGGVLPLVLDRGVNQRTFHNISVTALTLLLTAPAARRGAA